MRGDEQPILVAGVTGYIGGRLVPRLLQAGHRVRCLARDPRKVRSRPWAADTRVDIRTTDLSSTPELAAAMYGCRAAFYLVRSSDATQMEVARQDLLIAKRFAEAAERAGLARIVCLSGLLGPPGEQSDVEQILRSYATPVTILRTPMIIGSGSISFEMLRFLIERMPILVTPKWASIECQPIAVRNVLEYLIRCLSVPATAARSFDIGGPEGLTYRELMRIMAEELGLPPRIIIPVPVRAPRLSALWVHLVTPIGYRVAVPRIEELCHPTVCEDGEARRLMPARLLTAREAIQLALTRVQERQVWTAWSSAGPIPGDPDWSGGTVLTDARSVDLCVPPTVVYRAVCQLGGANGWYAADWLWRLRGLLDRVVGGPGLRRGRRDPEALEFGDAVDFWRVTGLQPNRELTLRAEMRLPGVAELHFAIEPRDARGATLPLASSARAPRSRLTQIARFLPSGLAGLAYWYAMLPFHAIVFARMLRGIQLAARRLAVTGAETSPQAGR